MKGYSCFSAKKVIRFRKRIFYIFEKNKKIRFRNRFAKFDHIIFYSLLSQYSLLCVIVLFQKNLSPPLSIFAKKTPTFTAKKIWQKFPFNR
jgi:hypothetical protein